MKTQQLEINRAILEIENIYPTDNLITTYKEFLVHREYLHLYQYNPNVFNSLISLTESLWESKKRISRFSLITVTRRYFKKNKERNDVPADICTKLFGFFKTIVVDEDIKMNSDSVEKMKFAINSMLQGIRLNESEINLLCANINELPRRKQTGYQKEFALQTH